MSIKSEFKILCRQASIRGVSASSRYEDLKKAQRFAEANNLEFPAELKSDLGSVARQMLSGYVKLTHAIDLEVQRV